MSHPYRENGAVVQEPVKTKKPWYDVKVPNNLNPYEDTATFMHTVGVMWKIPVFEYDPDQKQTKPGVDYLTEIKEKFNVNLAYVETKSKNYKRFWFYNDETYIFLLLEDDSINSYCISLNEQTYNDFVDWYGANTTKVTAEAKSPIYVIGSKNGLCLDYAGDALAFQKDSKLIEGNYSEDVVEKYHYIVEQFSKRPNIYLEDENEDNIPQGRIAILHGIPGSGKTWMVRSMVAALKDVGKTIFIPPEMISQIGSPSFMSLLIEQKEKTQPFILVMEDADSCLAPRAGDNMHLISSLLNNSDGVLGGILDIRIIATSNAKHDSFDEAIMRDGRLCEEVYIGPLSSERAKAVFNRLTNGEQEFAPAKPKDEYTLAEVYALAGKAKRNSRIMPKKTKRSMGFE